MLLNIDRHTKDAVRAPARTLKTFDLSEEDLQNILFKTLDRLIADDELILLMESRKWQEEPDLMAVDKDGNLFIFELKAWESQSSNLLQVLRYGQIFGSSTYADLNALYQRQNPSQTLAQAHAATFGIALPEEKYNQRQVFVVVTNGVDHRTREAIRYWRSCSLDVRPWIYRVYESAQPGQVQLEMAAFRTGDNPYEDLAGGYWLLNTNYSNSPLDHEDMLKEGKAAAYFEPWKFKIERIQPGDTVFLYRSGKGIVGWGKADKQLQKRNYQDRIEKEYRQEEYFRRLLNFQRLSQPMTAARIKAITGINYCFMTTLFGLDAESGEKIRQALSS